MNNKKRKRGFAPLENHRDSNRENCSKMKKGFGQPYVQTVGTSNSLTGFTMVEMLAVLVIIGLIVTIVAGAAVSHVGKARITTTKASIVKIKEAIQTYKMYKHKYPDTLEELVPEYIAEDSSLLDAWENKFEYASPGDERDFDLISGGPDRDVNTPEDNISIWSLKDKDQ